MRTLILAPSSSNRQKIARYSFMHTEMLQLSQYGFDIHTIFQGDSPSHTTHGIHKHQLPQIRNINHSIQSIKWVIKKNPWLNTGTAHIFERFVNARINRMIYHIIKRERIQLVYSNFLSPQTCAGLPASMAAGIPCVLSLRGVDIFTVPEINYGNTLSPYQLKKTKLSLHHADHIYSLSQALQDRAIDIGADPNKMSVIRKGVDAERFQPGNKLEVRCKLKIPNQPTLLYLGGDTPVKGYQTLLHAFPIVLQTIPHARLIMGGPIRDLSALKAYLQDFNLSSHTTILGPISRANITHHFQACDILIIPSLSEGAGNVILEAAACAIPSIGSNIGGIPEYIQDKRTGLLFKKSLHTDLAQKIIQLLTNIDLTAKLGQAARDHVLKHHTQKQNTQQIADLLLRVQATSHK